MIIDFHTHIFPDKIADRTIALLSEKGGIPPFSDGTVNGLLEKMELAGVDIAVTLPVLTSPAQFDSVNRYAAEVNSAFADSPRRLISFAGIHPQCEDIEGKMRQIRERGFRGVKIHPDYQGAFIDDEGYERILRAAVEQDLIVVTHSGVDTAFLGQPVRCTPERALRLIRRVPYAKLVLAHFGANGMPNTVIEQLCGEDVYFDTAYMLRFIGEESFLRILEKHGADRLLFASDSPWSDIAGDVAIVNSFPIDEPTKAKIFCENAKTLLGL